MYRVLLKKKEKTERQNSMYIDSTSLLREAYEELFLFKNLCQEFGVDYDKATKRIKKSIREYYKRQRERNIIKDYGIDGYVELLELPISVDTWKTEEKVCEYFEESEFYIEPYYSAYDCTGKAFTSWFKPVLRRGKWYVYHSVCFDV